MSFQTKSWIETALLRHWEQLRQVEYEEPRSQRKGKHVEVSLTFTDAASPQSIC